MCRMDKGSYIGTIKTLEWALLKILIWDPCPFGRKAILAVAQIANPKDRVNPKDGAEYDKTQTYPSHHIPT